jgi:hypothetical protein
MPAFNFIIYQEEKMKTRFLKISLVMAILIAGMSSCKKEAFIEANTDPGKIYNITPEEQLTNASIAMFDADFEYYYDYYRIMMPWLQYHTANLGNAKTFMSEVGNFNQRYNYFYTRVGNVLTDVIQLIERMPEEEKAQRQHQKAIAQILKIYYGFYTSEINGSLPYTEAFQARYDGTLTPKYDTQEELFTIFESELKQIVSVLSTGVGTQKSFGNADLYYNGDANKWKKAANVLRLRIAMRLMKRKPDVLKTIAMDVLSNPDNVFASNADNLVLITGTAHTNGGNWDPTNNGLFPKATKSLVDFMWETGDPRIRIFYQKNSYSQENVNLAVAQGLLPAGSTWNPRQYVGGFSNPDAAVDPANSRFYATRTIRRKNSAGTDVNWALDTVSRIQYRLFSPALPDYSASEPFATTQVGTGNSIFPLLTYPELCFYRAELAARGITTENAATQYENGVKASMKLYDQFGNLAKVFNYQPITDAEINTAYQHPKVKFNPAIGLEQIYAQSYIHFFKQANEGWSLYKRTGMPNSTTVLPLERILADGVEQRMPRRALINVPRTTDLNYKNSTSSLEQMGSDPGFGQGPSDIFGRVWWDQQ